MNMRYIFIILVCISFAGVKANSNFDSPSSTGKVSMALSFSHEEQLSLTFGQFDKTTGTVVGDKITNTFKSPKIKRSKHVLQIIEMELPVGDWFLIEKTSYVEKDAFYITTYSDNSFSFNVEANKSVFIGVYDLEEPFDKTPVWNLIAPTKMPLNIFEDVLKESNLAISDIVTPAAITFNCMTPGDTYKLNPSIIGCQPENVFITD